MTASRPRPDRVRDAVTTVRPASPPYGDAETRCQSGAAGAPDCVLVPPTSERFRWLTAVRETEARRVRTRALRAELAAARDAGKARRHADRLARARRDRP